MLTLVSHIAKCDISVIKVSIKFYKYPVVTRTIQKDCCLVTCLSDHLSLYCHECKHQTSTQMSQLISSLKQKPTKPYQPTSKSARYLLLSLSTLSLLAASVIYFSISPTNVCIFLWWLFVPRSPSSCSSLHHQTFHNILLSTSFSCQLLAGNCPSYLEN